MLVLASVFALLSVGTARADSRPTPVKSFVLLAQRTSAGASQFNLDFGARYHTGDGAFFGDMGVRLTHDRITQAFAGGMTSVGYSDNDTFTYGGHTTSVCSPTTTVLCVNEGPGGIAGVGVGYSDNGDEPNQANAYLFAMSGRTISYTFTGVGWRIRQVDLPFRYVDGSRSDDVGVNVGEHGASVFSTASAAGGSQGSLAEAVPPCSNSEVAPAREGIGQLFLDGGVSQQQQLCPGVALGQAIGSWTAKKTMWIAHGHIVGANTLYSTRLLEIDTPRIFH